MMKIIETEYRGMFILAPDEPESLPEQTGDTDSGEVANTQKMSESREEESLLAERGVHVHFGWETEIEPGTKDVLSGLRFQINPEAQRMLVRCATGAATYYIVDLRRGTDTYCDYFSIELSADNQKQLFIPAGFAHGFFTLTDDALICERVDRPDSPEHQRLVSFYDLQFNFRFQTQITIRPLEDEKAVPFLQSGANFSIKVLVTGATGKLGYEVIRRLEEMRIEAIGTSREDFDITDREQTERFIERYRPDIVIHCAGYTNVDQAEDEEALCFAVNVDGAANVARVCRAIDAKMVYVSTNHVFDGEGRLIPQVEEPVNPMNVYGRSRVAGEQVVREIWEKHFIARISWLYGIKGDDFVKRILKKIDAGEPIYAASDQAGAPTYAIDLAKLLVSMTQTVNYGTYHASNMKNCSRYEFVQAILKKSGIEAEVIPVLAADYPTKAKRPNNYRMSKDKLKLKGFSRMPTWQNAIGRYLKELKNDPEFAHIFPEPVLSEKEKQRLRKIDEQLLKAKQVLTEMAEEDIPCT